MLTALPDAANDLTLPCHEQRAGAATVCVTLCVWHCVCDTVCVTLCVWHCVCLCVTLCGSVLARLRSCACIRPLLTSQYFEIIQRSCLSKYELQALKIHVWVTCGAVHRSAVERTDEILACSLYWSLACSRGESDDGDGGRSVIALAQPSRSIQCLSCRCHRW